MDVTNIISQIDTLLSEFNRARDASPHNDLSGGLQEQEMIAISTRMKAAIERLAPKDSSYLADARSVGGYTGKMIIAYTGILQAMRDDYSAGYLKRVESLIQAGVFDNFLEMADELLSKKYKNPAAVVAGSTLEEHVRKLAASAGVRIVDSRLKKRKFDELAIDLVKSSVFSEPQRKIIVGWYSIRNEAAHGNYANVTETDVKLMIQGIREFIVRVPA